MTRILRRWTPLVLAGLVVSASSSALAAGGPSFVLGSSAHASMTTYQGFYDGHKDTYVITDVSDKAQSTGWHINYSPELRSVKGVPLQYFVEGAHASGQLAVFGSEPGESDYNPLWLEVVVTWKAGVKPVLLVRDDQINALAKAGKLTAKSNGVVLNAPITKVG